MTKADPTASGAAAARPRTRAQITSVEVGAERVVFDSLSGSLFRLDPIGALVWPFLDGTATVAELADDVAAAFDEDPGEVRRALDALVERLAQLDLLED